jgi:hypothetical protein
LFADNYSSGEGGSAVYLEHCTAFFKLCTFSGNATDGSGGGIFNRDDGSNFTLQNCVFWNNSDSGRMDESAQVHSVTKMATIDYCCIQGWTGNFGGTGNIDNDPCFVELGFWADPNDPNIVRDPTDPNAIWIDGDYHLLAVSPCIDAGDNSAVPPSVVTDLDGNARIVNGIVDMGAYEFQNTPPVADAGADQVVECACSTAQGTKVTLDGTGSYDVDGDPLTYTWSGPFVESPEHGATPTVTLEDGCPSDYVITLVVNDGIEDSEADDVVITVVDTTPPDINCPADVTLECPADTSVEASGSATAGDTCGGAMITHSDEWQTSCSNTGIMTPTWTATDECGNSSSCVQTLTVVDTTPPEFQFSVTPTILWPPNHKMELITPSWVVSDECDNAPEVSLVSIVANEGDDTIGDGHKSDDIQIAEDGSIYLRSERSGRGSDRVYTITYQAMDDCGNATVRSATVSIPHDFKVLARITDRWLWAGPAGRIPEDLNGDGVVNLKDFARFAENWIQ